MLRMAWCGRFLLLLLVFLGACRPQASGPGELVVSVPYDPASLDPHASDTVSGFAFTSQFYEPLVRTDASMRIVPALARTWENPDALTWVFHLQPGVKFHSGKPLTSADVIYSFRRLLQNPDLEMKSYLSNIVDVEAPDASTVTLRARRPLGVFLNRLNFVAIVPDGATSEFLKTHENGTGPYQLVSWTRDRAQVRSFDGYWGTRPDFPLATLLLNRSAQQALEDLKKGRCRLAQSRSRELQNFTNGSNEFDMVVHDSLFTRFLSYDMTSEVAPHCSAPTNPFRNLAVRQAIRKALDLQQLTRKIPSFAVPATQPVPPFVFGFNPALKAPEPDPAGARELLTRAGYPGGFRVRLNVRNMLVDAASEVREQLGQIGIQVDIVALSSSDFYGAISRRDFSFILTGLGCITGDASTVLEDAFHTIDPVQQYGNNNFGGFSDPVIDRQIEAASGIIRTEDRLRALQATLAQVMDRLPWIPLYVDQEAYGVHKKLSWTPRNDSYIFLFEIREGR